MDAPRVKSSRDSTSLMTSALKNWLVLSRCANLPTVWSNVMSGWLYAVTTVCLTAPQEISGRLFQPVFGISLLVLLAGLSMCYVGGMILNDVFDFDWDCQNRPERPLPRGVITLRKARRVGWLLILLGSLLSVFASLPLKQPAVLVLVFLLIISIIGYNLWHKNNPFAPVVMGFCRALLPLIGFYAAEALPGKMPLYYILIYTFTLWVFTISLTWVAKYETGQQRPPLLMEVILFLIPLPLILFYPPTFWSLGVLIFYYSWIGFSNFQNKLPGGVAQRVADRIAALPLLDALFSGLLLLLVAPIISGAGSNPVVYQSARDIGILAIGFPFFCFCLTLGCRRLVPAT